MIEFIHAGQTYRLVECSPCGIPKISIRRVSDNMWLGFADNVDAAIVKIDRIKRLLKFHAEHCVEKHVEMSLPI